MGYAPSSGRRMNLRSGDIGHDLELQSSECLAGHFFWADLGHLLGLLDSGYVQPGRIRPLLAALIKLDKLGLDFPRSAKVGDLFKNREDWLRHRVGDSVGWLAAGRARREANTIAFHLYCVDSIAVLGDESVIFAQNLLDQARQFQQTLFLDFTYSRPAQPTYFGHYLLSQLAPMLRSAEMWGGVVDALLEFPGGAGSTNGTQLVPNVRKVSESMGFRRPSFNLRDAVWRYDVHLRAAHWVSQILLANSRLAFDLDFFSNQVVGLVKLQASAKRGSVVMPQKDNPYLCRTLQSIDHHAQGLIQTLHAGQRTASLQIENRWAAYQTMPRLFALAQKSLRGSCDLLQGIQVDQSKARDLILKSGALGTDISENAVITEDMDYGQAHRTSRESSAKLAMSAQTLKGYIDTRKGIGGPQNTQIRKAIAEAEAYLKAWKISIGQLKLDQSSARKKLAKRAQQILKGK
jgi:argininosuccinate lyase